MSDIAYVLDPSRGRCDLWVRHDQAYGINSLGLRGAEIAPKRSGVRRVVIVGDSWVFGWKLHDRDLLASQLQRRVDGAAPGAVEFVTVALPGWNTLSEAAFLRTYSHVLEPDLVVWQMSQNDVDDAMGAVPPGLGSIELSPQVASGSPFIGLCKHVQWPRMAWFTTCPMPFILERWQRNFGLMRDVLADLRVPGLALLAGIDPRFVQLLRGEVEIPFPVLFEPTTFDSDPRWEVEPGDGHPSPWGVGMLVPPILERLSAMGVLDGVPLTEAEREVSRAWRDLDGAAATAGDLDRWLRDYAAEIPRSVDRTAGEVEIPGVGVRGHGAMADRGVLFLRAEPSDARLLVDLELVESRPLARTITFSLASYKGKPVRVCLPLQEQRVRATLPLPPIVPSFPVVEVAWRFDSPRCDQPFACTSATLARLAPAP